jgi:hypothetical protein
LGRQSPVRSARSLRGELPDRSREFVERNRASLNNWPQIDELLDYTPIEVAGRQMSTPTLGQRRWLIEVRLIA